MPAPAPPSQGPVGDIWQRYFVTAFDVDLVAAMRRSAAIADHTIQIAVRIADHPTLGGAGRTFRMNPLIEAGIDHAHSVGLTGSGQILSMIDGAPRLTHEQFGGKTIYVTGSGDLDTHGTAVAAILAGTGGMGTAIGVAPAADLHAGVLDFSRPVSWSHLAGVMRDARSLGAIASNNSWSTQGVTVANTDLGALFASGARADYLSAVRDFTRSGVVVFAAGNDYHATSISGMAGLPSAFPDLEANWLAVTSAIPEMGPSGVIAATRVATACLEAARWCITANGHMRIATADSDAGYAIGAGTSFAAPQVSGALALLAEAFPGLTPGQLRDRLLVTAEDGFFQHTGVVEFAPGISSGYNEEFGHGFLDVRAALLPIGQHVMPMADGSVRAFTQPVLLSGGAAGDAPRRALEQVRIVSMDGLHGRFETDARHLAAVATPSHDLGMFAQRAALEQDVGDARPGPGVMPRLFGQDDLRSSEGGIRITGLPGPEDASGGMSIDIVLPSVDADIYGATLRRGFDAGDGRITLGISAGSRRDGLLGLQGWGDGDRISGATIGAILGYSVDLGGSSRFGIEAEIGVASGRGSGLVSSLSGMRFTAMRADWARTDLISSGDRMTISASLPVAFTSGQASMALPLAAANGTTLFAPTRIGLAPSARQMDLSIGYERPLDRGLTVRAGVIHSLNHGHQVGAAATSGVIGLSMRF